MVDAIHDIGSDRLSIIKLFNLRGSMAGNTNVLTQIVTPRLPGIWKRIDAHERMMRDKDATSSVGRHAATLTSCQREVFDLLLRGKTPREVATILGKNHQTIRHHASAVYRAFAVGGHAGLIAKFSRT
jgi:DNA-binding CsgD family transcriptional regulator